MITDWITIARESRPTPLTQVILLSCRLLGVVQYSSTRVCDSCLKWSIPILTLPFRWLSHSWLGVKLASEGDVEHTAFTMEALPLLLHGEQLRTTPAACTRGEVLWPILQRGPTDALLLPSWGSGADLWWGVLEKQSTSNLHYHGIVVVIKIWSHTKLSDRYMLAIFATSCPFKTFCL